ncbi:MAG TPA: hypothetical protein VI699_02660, partial [Candidatus Acidoferrales bacterium]|nr:hypothetical protein [Candidatus Acidoferrales bacterium]
IWFIDGELLGVLIFAAAGLLWLLLPFFDPEGRGRAQHWILGAGIFALTYIAGMTAYAYMAK